MAILIGTDEAGYGPNLGPLVITATAWRVADQAVDEDLYDTLRAVVCRSAQAGGSRGQVAIADSKLLYRPGAGLDGLERGVLSSLVALGRGIRSWRNAWRSLAPDCLAPLDELPWYADYDRAAPIDADPAEIGHLGEALAGRLEQHGARLVDIRAEVVFPDRFNRLVEQFDSKGAALSHVTLRLVHTLLGSLEDRPAVVHCDKHGGRNRYAPLLHAQFPEHLVQVVSEGRQQSRYRWGPVDGRVEFRFTAKGESFLPSALASMVSKYLRELAMMALNEFWSMHVPELKPTAGYPVDARRFKAEITAKQRELGIPDEVLWRSR